MVLECNADPQTCVAIARRMKDLVVLMVYGTIGGVVVGYLGLYIYEMSQRVFYSTPDGREN